MAELSPTSRHSVGVVVVQACHWKLKLVGSNSQLPLLTLRVEPTWGSPVMTGGSMPGAGAHAAASSASAQMIVAALACRIGFPLQDRCAKLNHVRHKRAAATETRLSLVQLVG